MQNRSGRNGGMISGGTGFGHEKRTDLRVDGNPLYQRGVEKLLERGALRGNAAEVRFSAGCPKQEWRRFTGFRRRHGSFFLAAG